MLELKVNSAPYLVHTEPNFQHCLSPSQSVCASAISYTKNFRASKSSNKLFFLLCLSLPCLYIAYLLYFLDYIYGSIVNLFLLFERETVCYIAEG